MRDMRGALQVFVSGKKQSKEFGGTEAFNRIKREMVEETKGMGPEEQVLLIGCSAAQTCVRKDEKAFMGFFAKHIYLPLPDHASHLGPGLVRLVSCFVPAFVFVAVALHAACLCFPVLIWACLFD